MSRIRQLLYLLGAVTFCVCFNTHTGIPAYAQTLVQIHIVDHPRPVAAAVRQVEKQFGYVVTYEDTIYVNPADIVDATDQVARDRSDPRRRVFQMRGGNIDFQYTPRSMSVDGQVGEVLQRILVESRKNMNIGDFRVDVGAGAYHVIPTATNGRKSQVESYESPLEARITFAFEEGNALTLLHRLVQVISTASGKRLVPGTMPRNFGSKKISIDAHDDRARDVLWRTLQSMGGGFSWQLLCGVGDEACAFNVYPISSKF